MTETTTPSAPTSPQSTGAQKLAAVAAIASAVAALGSLTVAIMSLKTNADYQHRQLRAYVDVLSSTFGIDVRGGSSVVMVFENTGQTPATNVRVQCFVAQTSSPFLEDSDFPASAGKVAAAGSLAPRHQGSCRVPTQMSLTQLENFKRGTASLGARAYIDYDDEFGGRHTSKFTAILGGTIGLPSDGRMAIAPESGEGASRRR